MELNEEQQAEYDKLFKALVAQGGPTLGKLKAAGRSDPEGVARLVELGWVNPDAEPLTMENVGFDTSKPADEQTDEVAAATGGTGIELDEAELEEPKKTPEEAEDASSETLDPDGELEKAKQVAEDAQNAAEDAIRIAAETAADVVDKTPPPCSRCNGDGFWHSTKTGYRARTSSEPLIDESRPCPECK